MDKRLLVLRELGSDQAVTFAELSQKVPLPPAELVAIMVTLSAENYVENLQRRTGPYRLTSYGVVCRRDLEDKAKEELIEERERKRAEAKRAENEKLIEAMHIIANRAKNKNKLTAQKLKNIVSRLREFKHQK